MSSRVGGHCHRQIQEEESLSRREKIIRKGKNSGVIRPLRAKKKNVGTGTRLQPASGQGGLLISNSRVLFSLRFLGSAPIFPRRRAIRDSSGCTAANPDENISSASLVFDVSTI